MVNNSVGGSAWSATASAPTRFSGATPAVPTAVRNVSTTSSTATLDIDVVDDGSPNFVASGGGVYQRAFDVEVYANATGRALRSGLAGTAMSRIERCEVNFTRTIDAVAWTASAEAERAPLTARCVVRLLPALSRCVAKARHVMPPPMVWVYTAADWSPPSSEFTTAEPSAPTKPLALALDASFATTSSALRIAWEPPYDEGGVPLASYTVVVKPLRGFGVGRGSYSPFRRFVRPAGAGSDAVASSRALAILNLIANTTYRIDVFAANAVNRSAASATLVERTALATAPLPPGRPWPGAVVMPSSQTLRLHWAPSPDLRGAILAAYRVTATCVDSTTAASRAASLDVNGVPVEPTVLIDAATLQGLGYDGGASAATLRCTITVSVTTETSLLSTLRSNSSDALVVTLGPVGSAILSAPTKPGVPILGAPSTGSTLTVQWAQPRAFMTAQTEVGAFVVFCCVLIFFETSFAHNIFFSVCDHAVLARDRERAQRAVADRCNAGGRSGSAPERREQHGACRRPQRVHAVLGQDVVCEQRREWPVERDRVHHSGAVCTQRAERAGVAGHRACA